jgi:hypothetical protein
MKNAQAERILEELESHPLTRQIREEKAAEILREREAAAAKIEAIRQEAEAVIPGLQARLDGAKEELARHDEGRKVIQDKIAMTTAALMKTKQSFEHERGRAEEILLSNYDERIDEGIRFFRDHFDALRRKKADFQTHKGETNLFTWAKELVTFTNGPAINAGLYFSRCAVENLEAMKLEPRFDPEKIETLKRQIPDTGELTEITTEKPIPKDAADVNPLHLLPSDSEREWSMGKLLKKIDKVLRQ